MFFCKIFTWETGIPPVPKPKTIFGYQKLLLLPLLGDHRDISALYSKIYLWCTHTYVGLVLNLPKIRTCIYIYMYWRGRNFVMYEYFVLNFQREMNASWKIFSFINFFQLTYVSDMNSLCTPFVVYRKATSAEKTHVMLFWYVNRNNIISKIFLLCVSYWKGEWPRHE